MAGKVRRALLAHEQTPHVTQQALDSAIATHAATPHGGNAAWADITGRPSTFPPEAHSHDYAATNHSHTKADVGLGNVDNTADASKPVSTATQTALDGKAASGHNHAGVYEPANANIQAHVASAHAPANAQKNSDITKAEIEAKLTGEISSHTHAGGGSGPTTKAGVVNLGAGASVVVTFGAPFAVGVTPVVVISSVFNGADTSTTLYAHTITNVGFTMKGAGNAAGNVAWIATNAGNS